jgi:hypothetical protein
MSGVFISYAREDRETARQLAGVVEASGYDVWWDRELVAGNTFAEVIEAKLDSADAIIVLWSEHSRKSYWVRDEAAVGRDRNRLIPLALDDAMPPLGFRQLHTPSLSGWDGKDGAALKALWSSLSGLTGRAGGSGGDVDVGRGRRAPIVAGVTVAPNNKSMSDILRGEKRQRSFLQTFWITSFVISAIASVGVGAMSPLTSANADEGVFFNLVMGFLWMAIFLSLGRFMIVVGRRLSKRKSVQYFDQPTVICLGISGLLAAATLASSGISWDNAYTALLAIGFLFPITALFSIVIGLFKGFGRKTFEDGK